MNSALTGVAAVTVLALNLTAFLPVESKAAPAPTAQPQPAAHLAPATPGWIKVFQGGGGGGAGGAQPVQRYVDFAHGVVDDETGRPIQNVRIEYGKLNPDKPDDIIWEYPVAPLKTDQPGLTNQHDGALYLFRADGYVSQVLSRNAIITASQNGNFQVRMKHGGEIHGTVLDHAGRPLSGAIVFLAPVDLGFLGLIPIGISPPGAGNFMMDPNPRNIADPSGRFASQGIGTNGTRLIAVSRDLKMVQPLLVSGPGQDVKITFPEPASLVVHYDILGDESNTLVALTLRTNELKFPLWNDISFRPCGEVPNGGQIVLSNLLPGVYDLTRLRGTGGTNGGGPFVFGDRREILETDRQRVVLQSGRTQQVNLVRSAGQRVQGQVIGLEASTNIGPAVLFVASPTAIRSREDFRTNKLDPCFDIVGLAKDGKFQTSLLEPGTYTLIAEAYFWSDVPERQDVPGDEPVIRVKTVGPVLRLALVGSAKVTVTTNAPPSPVRFALHPLDDAGGAF